MNSLLIELCIFLLLIQCFIRKQWGKALCKVSSHQRVLLAILATCRAPFYTPNHIFQNCCLTYNFALLDGPVVLSMLFSADWIMNLSQLFFSVIPVWSGDCEREGFSLMFGTLAGSEPHWEPSSQERVFYWGRFWFVLCFPHLQHLERAKQLSKKVLLVWRYPKAQGGEAGAVYMDMNVVLGPSAMLWPWSHPLLPQHMSSVEQGGGEEWNW